MQEKRTYHKPFIQVVEIDNSISLAMQSEGETPPSPMMAKPTDNAKDPFKTNPFGSSTKKK